MSAVARGLSERPLPELAAARVAGDPHMAHGVAPRVLMVILNGQRLLFAKAQGSIPG